MGNGLCQASVDAEEASGTGKAMLCFMFVMQHMGLEILRSYVISLLGALWLHVYHIQHDVRILCLANN